MINRVVLVGRMTKDPELRYTQSNIPVATFTLAVNRSFTTNDGRNEADFIPCVVWRNAAENVSKYTKKGSLVGVDGRIQTRNYEAQDGSRRYVTEIVCDNVRFLDSRSTSTEESRSGYENEFNQGRSDNQFSQMKEEPEKDPFASSSSIVINDDDLPF